MTTRRIASTAVATALALLATSTATAPAADGDVVPLAGKGEAIQPIARVLLKNVNEVELAGDWAFLSSDRDEDGEGGLTIVNVKDPTKPFVEGRWTADMAGIEDGSYGDVDLSPDGNLAVLTNAHCETCAEGEVDWVVLIDVSDKKNPRLVGKIKDDDTMDYVHTSTLDNGTLYTNPQVAAVYPQPGNAHITVFDVTDPANPKKKGTIAPPTGELGLAHDTYVDHRPDGKTLLYGASIHKTDIFDITNPLAAKHLQTSTSTYTLSHDVQPNHDRSVIVVDDEGFLGGQLQPEVSACGKVGSGPASLDSGSVHFFKAAPDGTLADGGVIHLGTFNAPASINTRECVAHVFWQAPDENRMTQAYYRTGAFIVDFEDPADAKQLGLFVADDGANYWSHKPHRGYLFASDQDHGLDILKYTGEGGTRWPATAGPAEVQRSARQGVPYVPIGGTSTAPLPTPPSVLPSASGAAPAASERKLGRFSFTAKAKRIPGRKGRTAPLTVVFTTRAGKPAGKTTVRKPAARKATVKVRGVAVPGTYRWRLKAGRKVLKRGTFRVKASDGLALSPGARLAATAK